MNILELTNKIKTDIKLSAKDKNFTPRDMLVNFNAAAGLIQETWFSGVERFQVETSDFWTGTRNDSSFIDKFGTIHIPQMLTVPTIARYVKGSTSLPLNDTNSAPATELTYSGYQTYTEAFYGDIVDMHELSFDIIVELQKNFANALNIEKRKTYLWEWTVADTGNIKQTTGDAYTNNYGLATAKELKDADFLTVIKQFNAQGMDQNGRVAVLSPSHMNQLLSFIGSESYAYGLTDEAKIKGAVAMYRGFEIYSSNYTAPFSDATTKIAYGGATSATSKESSVFFHKDMVRHAAASPIEFTGDGIDYLAQKRIRVAQFMGATPSRVAVNNTRDGIVTLIDGSTV